MKRVVASVMAGLMVLASAGAVIAAPQETQAARGTVTAVSADSLTVTVKDQPMKFVVDGTTDVVAPGGGTMTRAAKADGKTGVSITSVVKVGQSVDVKYHLPAMHAASVRVLGAAAAGAPQGQPSAKSGAPTAKAGNASGQVTAVSGSSLTLKTSTGDATYAIDAKTRVIGNGLGTKAKEDAVVGKKQTLTDLVAIGDTVAVTSSEATGGHATVVRVTKKGK
ncbi:MAG: hypothetical protein ABIX28_00015 [Vicinamibacterales bacterium]